MIEKAQKPRVNNFQKERRFAKELPRSRLGELGLAAVLIAPRSQYVMLVRYRFLDYPSYLIRHQRLWIVGQG